MLIGEQRWDHELPNGFKEGSEEASWLSIRCSRPEPAQLRK